LIGRQYRGFKIGYNFVNSSPQRKIRLWRETLLSRLNYEVIYYATPVTPLRCRQDGQKQTSDVCFFGNMKQEDMVKHIADFLHTKYQMVIATYGEHPWIATVYYSLDSDLNFYFLSDPGTLHCKQIAVNPNVALSIGDAPQDPSAKKKCVQIFGVTEKISGMNKIRHALGLWRKTLGITSDAYTYEGMMKKLIKGRMYKVKPKKIKFFNEELWEEGSEPTISLE
jgi:uncharacterized protein YhbP (UPF0306 family)